MNIAEIEDRLRALNENTFQGSLAFRRNHRSYEYTSYVNHAIAFFMSKNWESSAIFIGRAEKFLKSSTESITEPYRTDSMACLEAMKRYFYSSCDSEVVSTYEQHTI